MAASAHFSYHGEIIAGPRSSSSSEGDSPAVGLQPAGMEAESWRAGRIWESDLESFREGLVGSDVLLSSCPSEFCLRRRCGLECTFKFSAGHPDLCVCVCSLWGGR